MDRDLASKLQRRLHRSESTTTDGRELSPPRQSVSGPFFEFKDIPAKTLKSCQLQFDSLDENKDKLLDSHQLRVFLERMGLPQTHLALKGLIKQFDSDDDGKVTFREFMLIYRRAQEVEDEENQSKLRVNSHDHVLDVQTAKRIFNKKTVDSSANRGIEGQLLETKLRRKLFKERLMIFNGNDN